MAQARVGEHAVVIGASMAGLATAKALVGAYERVTVLDRDTMPETARPRSGVPQGRHPHVLLAAGGDALEELFPGVLDDMVDDGAIKADLAGRGRWCVGGHRLARGSLGVDTVLATRPLMEATVRRRLRVDPTVRILERCDVHGLEVTPLRGRVEGVRVQWRDRDAARETMPADLVVDCSGRRSHLPRWLADLGYATPTVDQLRVDVRYSTRHYRLPTDVLEGDLVVYIAPTPDGPRGGVMMQVEDDQWLVMLAGMGGERPPSADQYESFAAALPISDLYDALRQGEPLDDPSEYRYPASARHRYERLRAFPAGLLAAGDAVCSFNPIYGQGMSVAALEAVALRDRLATGEAPDPQEWFSTVAAITGVPWELAVGGDLGIRCIEGPRPLRVRMINAYLARYHAAAATDPSLGMLFARVAGLLERPERLLYPGTVARVVRGNLRRRAETPPAPAPAGVR